MLINPPHCKQIYCQSPLVEAPMLYTQSSNSAYRQRFRQVLLENCPRGGTALETGIGAAYESLWLSLRGVNAFGIDWVAEIAEWANQLASSFTQDPNGNTILRVDARNWPTSYTIDQLNRNSQAQYIDGTRVTNSWDAVGQQIVSADSTGITSVVWDNDSRKIATQNPAGINLTSTLDPLGNRLVLQDNYGSTSYTWDAQSRLLSIWNPLNERTSLTWDPLDREQHRVLANGGTISHTWDSAGREILIENRNAAGAALFVATNTYSPVDTRLTVLETDGTRATFSYDASRQIVSEARGGTMAYARSYTWDPLGNRIQQYDSGVLTTGKFNAANQQILITPAAGPPTTQTFDNVGNMTLEQTGAASITSTWTPENRLASYVDSLGNSIESSYSDDGLRRQRTVNGATTNLTYDDTIFMLETDTTGSLVARYTNFPEIWGGLVSQNRSGTTWYFGFDSQTSARILVSVSGLVTDSFSWKAFGEPIQTGSGTITPYGYVAGAAYYIELPDLLNAWNRWMKPSMKQWRSVDPIGIYGWDPDQYGYVGNGPTTFMDPSGLVSDDVKYDPGVWNKPDRRKNSNCTCYAWCFIIDRTHGIDPGYINQNHDSNRDPDEKYSCARLVLNSIRDGLITVPAGGCPTDWHKVALYVRNDGGDYHWYRQDSDGTWSNKPGEQDATNCQCTRIEVVVGKDGKPLRDPYGKPITHGFVDPNKPIGNPDDDAKARGYGTPCGFLCAPNSWTKSRRPVNPPPAAKTGSSGSKSR